MTANLTPARRTRRLLATAALLALSGGAAALPAGAATSTPGPAPVPSLMLACRFSAAPRQVLCYSNTRKPATWAYWLLRRSDGVLKNEIGFNVDHAIVTPDFRAVYDPSYGPRIDPAFRTVVDPNVRALVDPNEKGLVDPNDKTLIDPNETVPLVHSYSLTALDGAGRVLAQSPVVNVTITA